MIKLMKNSHRNNVNEKRNKSSMTNLKSELISIVLLLIEHEEVADMRFERKVVK